MSTGVKPIPEGYHSVTPYLCIKRAADAMEFYRAAFDTTELLRIPSPDGSIGHAEIQIGDSRIMLSDESAEMDFRSPTSIGGTLPYTSIYIWRTLAESPPKPSPPRGSEEMMVLEDQFWGDRTGTVVDPFEHRWYLSTDKGDLTEEELNARVAQLSEGA